MVIEIRKRMVIMLLAVLCSFIAFSLLIPTVKAPIWYGSGDDSGLVGRWSCEGNFNDSSGMNNHGTQSGGVTITSGVKGRACRFDGTNDYILASTPSSIRNSNNFTIAFWAHAPSYTTPHMAFSISTGTSASTLLGIYPYETLNGNGVRVYWNGASVIDENGATRTGWNHFVYISRNATDKEMYVNGLSIQTNTTSKTLGNYENLRIGTWYENSQNFRGTIDEVRIYNRSLSASEVANLYNTSKSYYLNFKATPTQGLIDESGLVGYWTFNSKDGSNRTNATDKSGLQNHGTVTGATFTNEGRFKEGYKFDGVNDYISSANPTTKIANVSMAVWVNIISTSLHGAFIKTGTATIGNTTGYGIGVGNSTLDNVGNNLIGLCEGIAWIGTGQAIGTGWHHITYILNQTGHHNFYIDGNFVYGTGSCTPFTPSGNTKIGGYEYPGYPRYFNGTIDEVRIYNRSLSASEVAALYNGTKSTHITLKATPTLGILNTTADLVGYWTFDSKDGSNRTNATDKSGLQNHGTVTGATFTNEGRFKEGYKFDGVNDWIEVPDANSLDIFGGVTVSAWIYPKRVNANLEIARKENGNQRLLFSLQTGNILSLGTYNGTAYSELDYSGFDSTFLNKWAHIAATHNSSGFRQIYLNGAPVLNDNVGNGTSIIGTAILYIGAIGSAELFNGTIDEVRIYNRSLSASEVAGLYNGTKSNFIEWKAVVG